MHINTLWERRHFLGLQFSSLSRIVVNGSGVQAVRQQYSMGIPGETVGSDSFNAVL